MAKTRFKIFMGTYAMKADVDMNEWLDENPNVKVVDFKYQQARFGDHSICIMYEVEDQL